MIDINKHKRLDEIFLDIKLLNSRLAAINKNILSCKSFYLKVKDDSYISISNESGLIASHNEIRVIEAEIKKLEKEYETLLKQ